MAEINGMYTIYTADDEMPDCLNCDNCDGKYDCAKFCGSEHGWFGYRRTEWKKNRPIGEETEIGKKEN